jgi:hypothetical protein
MDRQVFQGLRHRGRVRITDGFVGHIAGSKRADQRHTFRGAERQIEAVHTTLAERPSGRSIRCCALVEPALHDIRIGRPASALNIRQADEFGHGVGVAGTQPDRGAGVVLGVVIPQPATSAAGIASGRAGGAGGVVVVVDRPPRQLGNRQHGASPERSNRLAHNRGGSTLHVCYR